MVWQATMVKGDLVWPHQTKGDHLCHAWSGRDCIYDNYACLTTYRYNTFRRWSGRPIMGDHQWHDIYANQDHRKSGMEENKIPQYTLFCPHDQSLKLVPWSRTRSLTTAAASGDSFYSCGPTLCILSRLRVKILRPLNSRNYSHVICSTVLI